MHVFPQYLYWGPLEAPVIAALAVIVLGAIWVLRAVRMLSMALSFLVPFTALIAVFAAGGQSFVAIWQEQTITGIDYWLKICTSPELLVFVCFMMSDPATAAKSPPARIVYGVVTAVVAAGLVFFQPTEFGIKVAILSSLTVVCALVPLIEAAAGRLRRASEFGPPRSPPRAWAPASDEHRRDPDRGDRVRGHRVARRQPRSDLHRARPHRSAQRPVSDPLAGRHGQPGMRVT